MCVAAQPAHRRPARKLPPCEAAIIRLLQPQADKPDIPAPCLTNYRCKMLYGLQPPPDLQGDRFGWCALCHATTRHAMRHAIYIPPRPMRSPIPVPRRSKPHHVPRRPSATPVHIMWGDIALPSRVQQQRCADS